MSEQNPYAQRVAELDAELRKRVKLVRLQQGVTQADVATQLGIAPQQYHKYESGVLRLSSGMVAQIAEALECSVLDIIPGSERSVERLDADKRLDILKQELSSLILDAQSEDVLVAVRTLLSASQTRDAA